VGPLACGLYLGDPVVAPWPSLRSVERAAVGDRRPPRLKIEHHSSRQKSTHGQRINSVV
jgi:hypothetical protein